MSTLFVVEEVLREKRTPLVVREIVEAAGERLPTKSRTPDTVVARDLSMDIKKRGEESKFIRVSPGRYTLREYAHLFKVTDVVASAPPPVAASAPTVTAAPLAAPQGGN